MSDRPQGWAAHRMPAIRGRTIVITGARNLVRLESDASARSRLVTATQQVPSRFYLGFDGHVGPRDKVALVGRSGAVSDAAVVAWVARWAAHETGIDLDLGAGSCAST